MTISVTVTNDEVGYETTVHVMQCNPAGRQQGPVTAIPSGERATFHVHQNNHLVISETPPEAARAAA